MRNTETENRRKSENRLIESEAFGDLGRCGCLRLKIFILFKPLSQLSMCLQLLHDQRHKVEQDFSKT